MDRAPIAAWYRETASGRDATAAKSAGGQLVLRLGRKDAVQFRLPLGPLEAIVIERDAGWDWSVAHRSHVLDRGSAPAEETAMAQAEAAAAGFAEAILDALAGRDGR